MLVLTLTALHYYSLFLRSRSVLLPYHCTCNCCSTLSTHACTLTTARVCMCVNTTTCLIHSVYVRTHACETVVGGAFGSAAKIAGSLEGVIRGLSGTDMLHETEGGSQGRQKVNNIQHGLQKGGQVCAAIIVELLVFTTMCMDMSIYIRTRIAVTTFIFATTIMNIGSGITALLSVLLLILLLIRAVVHRL
jgi:hypothetical protein